MMDERVKSVFQKIYAELFCVILFLCALSLIVKFAVFHMDASACIPEFPILVGSPIYMMIRTRMLGVTQVSAYASDKKSKLTIRLFAAVFVSFLIYSAIAREPEQPEGLAQSAVFIGIFAAVFLVVQILMKRFEQKRQEKLDSRYDD